MSKLKNKLLVSLFVAIDILFLSREAYSQAVPTKESKTEQLESISSSKYGLTKKAASAERNLKTDERTAAINFVQLADDLASKGAYQKAEANYKRAIAIFQKNDMKAELAASQRKLAKVQEESNRLKDAVSNYSAAAENAPTSLGRNLNSNDLKRVKTKDLNEKIDYAQQNIDLIDNSAKKSSEKLAEKSDALVQVATVQGLQNKNDDAVRTLSKAISIDKNQNASTEKLAEILSNDLGKNQDAAQVIASQIILLKAADSAKNFNLSLNINQQLGKLYAQNNQNQLAEQHYLTAYDLAKKMHLTIASKNALLALDSFYRNRGQAAKAQQLSGNFLNELDEILTNDSSLIDMKGFEATEKRIQQLEDEKLLQASVIKQTKKSNYLLLAVAVAIFVSLLILTRAYFAIAKRNKKIRLQSLRREMNPHFVFNSLNSVNQFIAENNELEANKYLTAYSTLMRTVMEHSSKDFVPLAVELDHLEKYLKLEHQRFHNQFEFTIKVDPEIDVYDTAIPNMIIQPYLENAIWHGLRYKETKGKLELTIQEIDKKLIVKIFDDGIGLEQSKALKTANQKQYKSLGMKNTKERIDLLNKLYKTKIESSISDRSLDGISGTIVEIVIPIQAINYESE